MGMVSGFWLTWYYFGYSAIYSSFIACVQNSGRFCAHLPALGLTGRVLPAASVRKHCSDRRLLRRRRGCNCDCVPVHPGIACDCAGTPRRTAPNLLAAANRIEASRDGLDAAHRLDRICGRRHILDCERNRAYLCVLKSASGRYRSRHFEVETRSSSVGIREQWLKKGSRIFEGHYTLSGTELTLAGRWQGQPVRFEMKRR